jgi:glutathione S-transferase
MAPSPWTGEGWGEGDVIENYVKIIGSYLSPYVRKVLAVLHLKNIPYQIDPIIPFMGNDNFSKLSPLRRVPVLIDDSVTLSDSSIICQYLEDRYPHPALYPQDIAHRAKARWFEEYADTRLGDVLIWQLYNQVMINPYVWGKPTDEATLQKTLSEEIPQILDYLETQIPSSGFLFNDLSIADISIASFFRNAEFTRFKVDNIRWPNVAAFVQKVLGLECFETLLPYEKKSLRTPIPHHREALAAMGAPLTQETYATSSPRPGILRI